MADVIDRSSYPQVSRVVSIEPEINAGRRAFPMAQQLFAGSPAGEAQALECGWYDTSVHPESGAFALVQTGAGLDDLIGEIVQVINGSYSVLVYVLQDASIPTPFGLYRRAWAAIANLGLESLVCEVVPVE